MKNKSIAILGGGNLGTSLAKGLINSGQFSYKNLIITEKREPRMVYLHGLGFTVTENNKDAVNKSQIVVASVKPQQFSTLAEEIREYLTEDHILISTVTGVSFREIENATGKIPMLRIMPNTALEICESMTCIAFKNTNPEQEALMTSMFEKMGKTLIIPEDMMDAATVVGACGIAFALRFMRAMSQGGIEIGFNSEMSQLITAQTVKGAAQLIVETSNHPEKEIDKVTTPQGITISGLNEMEHQGLSSAVIRGLITSFNKLENLGTKIHKIHKD
ncbi:MAG TPA: pyrroline-5-carboxylate reductase [Bacteroidales bacterium]|jgi:pyrroline-5-carboxylate reductase|nr:pyrroline-5-carboxylate reductase [Bacteroidales bacterium]